MADAPQWIVCESCGRKGPWRPEFVGKQIKCKCGNLIKVSSPEPVQAAASDEDLYDVREDAQPKKLPRLAPIAPPVDASTAEPAAARLGKLSPEKPDYKAAHDAEEKSKVIRLAIIFGAVVVIVVGAIVCMKLLSHPKPALTLGDDADIQERIDNDYNMEVHEWLKQDKDRIAGSWNTAQTLKHADDWQQMGAKKVIAFSTRFSRSLVIELPTDPAQRTKLFDMQAQWHVEHGVRVRKDVGQKYLEIELGI